jgi:hypothetical protein
VVATSPTSESFSGQFHDQIARHRVSVSGSSVRSVPGARVPRSSNVGAELHDPTVDVRVGGAQAAVCMREPLTQGQTIMVADRVAGGAAGRVEFRVARVTPHVQLLVPAGVYDGLSATVRGRIASLADSAEVRVHPFLKDQFGTLPDFDGTGRLTVLMSSGLFYAGPERYADGGCASGNFVNMGAPEDWFIATSWSAGTVMSFLRLLVHEATHWIDSADPREHAYPAVSPPTRSVLLLAWSRDRVRGARRLDGFGSELRA